MLHHVPRRELARIEDAMHVDPHNPVELRAVDLQEGTADGDPGVADQNVEATEFLQRVRKGAIDRARIRYIDANAGGECGQIGLDGGHMVRVAAPGADLGAFLQKATHDGGANAGGSAGHDRPFALQSHAIPPSDDVAAWRRLEHAERPAAGAALERHRQPRHGSLFDRNVEAKNAIDGFQAVRIRRKRLDLDQPAAARRGLCRMLALSPVDEERHERAEAVVVEAETSPTEPVAVRQSAPTSDEAAPFETSLDGPRAQCLEIGATGGPVIETFAAQQTHLALEAALRLLGVATEDLDIGLIAQRDQRVARPFTGMDSAIDRRRVHALRKEAAAFVEIGTIPDEMIDPHRRRNSV